VQGEGTRSGRRRARGRRSARAEQRNANKNGERRRKSSRAAAGRTEVVLSRVSSGQVTKDEAIEDSDRAGETQRKGRWTTTDPWPDWRSFVGFESKDAGMGQIES
jgi:hypothetical protein